MGSKVSSEQQTLLRRQALELSLYTLKYVDSIDSVVVFMPPEAKSQRTVFLRRSDVTDELDRPLSALLPTAKPKVGGLSSLEEGQILRLTRTRTYSAEVQASPDGSPVLILTPPGQTPDAASVNVPRVQRRALVTGAGSGIGRAIAARLEADGATVLAVDLHPDPDGPGEPFEADLSTRAGNRAAVDAALERFGGLDAVVANAGFQHVAPIEEFPEERWDAMLAAPADEPVPARPLRVGRARASPATAASSRSHRCTALVASPYKAGYVAAKHGVLGLVKMLALEGAEHGISASAICPGYVRTPLVESQIEAQAQATGSRPSASLEDVLLAPQAVKRMLEPEEVAETAAFLLGPGGRSFTGAPVVMDLGWTAR